MDSTRKPIPRLIAWIAWAMVLLIMWLVVTATSSSWEDKFLAGYESWHGPTDPATRDLLVHGTALTCGLLDEDPDIVATWVASSTTASAPTRRRASSPVQWSTAAPSMRRCCSGRGQRPRSPIVVRLSWALGQQRCVPHQRCRGQRVSVVVTASGAGKYPASLAGPSTSHQPRRKKHVHA